MASKKRWAMLDRAKRESWESWLGRNSAARVSDWCQQRIDSGAWLSPEEFERRSGRPGRSFGEVRDHSAAMKRKRS